MSFIKKWLRTPVDPSSRNSTHRYIIVYAVIGVIIAAALGLSRRPSHVIIRFTIYYLVIYLYFKYRYHKTLVRIHEHQSQQKNNNKNEGGC